MMHGSAFAPTFTDDFGRSDSSVVGNGWTESVPSGCTGGWSIASNQLKWTGDTAWGASTDEIPICYRTPPASANRFVQAAFISGIGLVTEHNGLAGYYGAYFDGTTYRIVKVAGILYSAVSTLASTTSGGLPGLCRLERLGNLLTLSVNGAPLLEATDSTYTATGAAVGFMAFTPASTSSEDNYSHGM